MRALQIQTLTGPDGLMLNEVDEPEDDGTGIVIEVKSAGVSFPDLLSSQGLYQVKTEPPFTGGGEFAGVVRSAPANSGFVAGDRVCASGSGGFADVAVAHPGFVFALPDQLSFHEGAALVVNYQTAVFCLGMRGGFSEGESLLVLGASGGVGTSGIQVARAIGASKIIGLVSTAEKGEIARQAGADDIVVISDTWKDEVLSLTGGRGVDVVYDPVGGDRFLDGIRSLARYGRLVVVGFAAGEIPQVKVNRLLLRNVSVVGAAWGEAMREDHELPMRIHERLVPMIESGVVKPPIGQVLPLEEGVDAYRLLANREAVGKVILHIAD